PGASRAMAMNAGAPPATAAAPARTDAAVPRPGPTRIAQAPPAPAAPAAPERPSNGSRLISFDFKDADVVNLLRILAAESTKNIVIGDDVKGKMSISLRNVPWDLAFQTILDTRGLQKIEKDGVIRIVSNDQLLKEREAQARVEESKLKAETEIRAKAAEAKLKEQEAIARERAVELELAKKLTREKLDIPLPQVNIEARLNELNRTDFFALGVSWGGAAVRRLTTGGDVLVGQGVSGQRNTAATIPPIIAPTGGIPPV